MGRHRVLIAEDEGDIAGLIKHALERGGDADAETVGTGTRRSDRSATARPISSSSI
jgi:hypothetical protein